MLAFPYQRYRSLSFSSLYAHNWCLPFSSVSSEPASAGIPSTTCWPPGSAALPTRSDEGLLSIFEALWHHHHHHRTVTVANSPQFKPIISYFALFFFIRASCIRTKCGRCYFPCTCMDVSAHTWTVHVSLEDYGLTGFDHDIPARSDLSLSSVTKATLCFEKNKNLEPCLWKWTGIQ